MAKPATPTAVDGHNLALPAQRYLTRLIALIHASDPLRKASDIETHAVATFRHMWGLIAGNWVAKPTVPLGDGEFSAVLVNPAAQ